MSARSATTKAPPRVSPAPRMKLDPAGFNTALAASGVNKGELCRTVGEHPSMLSKYLNGHREVSRDTAVLMAYVLEVPLDRIAVDRHTCPHCHGSLAVAA